MTAPVVPVPSEAAELAVREAQTTLDAGELAAMIVKGVEAPPAAVPTPEGAPAALAAPVTVEPAVADGGVPPAAPEVVEDLLEPVATPAEIETMLTEAGFDVGIDVAALPPEATPAFDSLARRFVELAQIATAREQEAAAAVLQVQEFSKQLEEHPDKLMLALAVTRPEVIAQFVERFNLMQTDPREKDMVIRELQAEARERETNRKERLLTDADRSAQARRVEAAVTRAARIHGVDLNVAMKVVAMAVKGNNNWLEVGDVDPLVSGLKPSKPAPKLVRVATPAKVAAAAIAPKLPVAPAPPAPRTTPGLTTVDTKHPGVGGEFRELVGNASRRFIEAVSGG